MKMKAKLSPRWKKIREDYYELRSLDKRTNTEVLCIVSPTDDVGWEWVIEINGHLVAAKAYLADAEYAMVSMEIYLYQRREQLSEMLGLV